MNAAQRRKERRKAMHLLFGPKRPARVPTIAHLAGMRDEADPESLFHFLKRLHGASAAPVYRFPVLISAESQGE